MTEPSAVVDLYADTANMYGCQPCPKCQSVYRYVARNMGEPDGPYLIQCDDCGYKEVPAYKGESQ